MISLDPVVWWAVALVICAWSMLYKETPLFRFVEYTAIGTGAGHVLVIAIWFLYQKGVQPIIQGNYVYIIAFILGALIYLQFLFPDYAYLQRYSIAILVGTYMGLSVRGQVGEIFAHLIDTVKPIYGIPAFEAINRIIILVMIVGGLFYFLFTEKLSLYPKTYKYLQYLGRFSIMTAFGFYMGRTITTRIGFIIARVQYIVWQWLGVIPS